MNTHSAQEKSLHLIEYCAIVRKRVWIVLSIFVVIVGLTIIWNLNTVPVYRATSHILIEPITPKVVNFDEVLDQTKPSRNADYYRTQYELLQSPSLARETVRALNLEEPNGHDASAQEQGLFQFLFNDLSSIQMLRYASAFVSPILSRAKSGSGGPPLTPEEIAINKLLKRLEIEPIRGTRLVRVHFFHSNPNEAAKIANKLSALYVQTSQDIRVSSNKGASDWLNKEIQKVRQELIKSEEELQKYKEKFNLVSLEDRQNIVSQKLTELNSAYTKAKTETLGLEVMVKKIRSINGKLADLNFLPDVMDSPMLQNLKKEEVLLQREYSDLSKRYKSGHPKLIRLNSQLNLMNQKIQGEIRDITKNILTRYQVALAKEKSLEKSLSEQKKEALRLNRMSISYRSMKNKVETNQEIYLDLLKRRKETGLLENLSPSNIRIVERAQIPRNPYYPRIKFNILLAMSASLFFGVALTLFVDHLDRRVRSPQEVETITGSPTLAVIADLTDELSELKFPLVVRGDQRGGLGNQYFRELGIMTIHRLNPGPKVVLVTSSRAGEGKTFISSNLALAMSVVNKNKNKILLVEGDLHRPAFGKVFGNVPSQGLSQVLGGSADIRESIRRYPKSSLGVLPAGNIFGEASSLLVQSELSNFIESVKPHFDYIVIDSPPLLSLSDSLLWAQYVDGVILVVDKKQVKPEMLEKATGKLEKLNVPILGTILNRETDENNKYYGYDEYHA